MIALFFQRKRLKLNADDESRYQKKLSRDIFKLYSLKNAKDSAETNSCVFLQITEQQSGSAKV